MMRLLKYDWKRNASTVLGLIAILLVAQIIIIVVGGTNGWSEAVRLTLSMLAYGVVSAILMVIVFKTFSQNIKSYNRRLLPVRSIWMIVSSIIQAWISPLVILTLVLLHLWLSKRLEELGQILDFVNLNFSDYVLNAFVGIWQYTFFMLVIFFSITVARAVRKRWAGIFGILLFLFISMAIQWVEERVFPANSVWMGEAIGIRVEEGSAAAPLIHETLTIPIGPFLFEVLLAGIMIYAMVKMIDRKVEV